MFIQNVSAIDVKEGDHLDAGERGVLIQIGEFMPEPKAKFEKIFQFGFMDVEPGDEYFETGRMTSKQARKMVDIMKMALDERRDVIIHCLAGRCTDAIF